MARACGLPEYKGEKANVMFKINFGKKIINECPMSYCDFSLLGDSINSWKYYEDGYLPEVYDTMENRPMGILDQSEFFIDSHMLVSMAKNKAEDKARKEREAQHK